MSQEILPAARARLEDRKKAKQRALKILRRRKTILKNIHRFSEEFGLHVYVHLEKNSRYGGFDVYSSQVPLHQAIARCYPLPTVHTPSTFPAARKAKRGANM